ncbi:MAG TPA: hypothetical protein V6C89_18015 [Drouetiella sp.]
MRYVVRSGAYDDDGVIDVFALMAYCYQQTNHPGLALAAESQATDLIQGSAGFPRQLWLAADAKYQLACYWRSAGNKLRAQRYFTEALEYATAAHLENTAFGEKIRQQH